MAVTTPRSRSGLSRFRRRSRRLAQRALGWALLSYVFAQTYSFLYGANPAVVPRLGTTIAVLCGVGVVLFGAPVVVLRFVEWAEEAWRYCRSQVTNDGEVR